MTQIKPYDKKIHLTILMVTFLFIGLLFPQAVSLCTDYQQTNHQRSSLVTSSPLTTEDIQALQQQGQEEGWTFVVGENAATQRPLEELCGTIPPESWPLNEVYDFDPVQSMGIPPVFDWRDHDGVPPIRDQDGCGSCWAFAAIGTVECGIKINEGKSVDLSEQWLVSCTESGSCDGGWHYKAYEYLLPDGLADPCGDSGAVLEQYFPYVAWDAPCGCPYPHDYLLQDWGSVAEDIMVIKQAILTFGPVSTTVYVNGAFQAYNGGVFNGCDSSHGINHAVVLVGWDDSQGPNGVWIMRNSWGPWWGENGYMKIPYECSNIGYSTCYIEYPIRDCNGNGIPDDRDINNGTCSDCNGNGQPDSCDVTYDISPDGNGNGIPDECEACQIEKITAYDGSTDDYYGTAVAFDGTRAVISAKWDDTSQVDSGSVYIYKKLNNQWMLEQHLIPGDAGEQALFGDDIALQGDTLIVGAPWDTLDADNTGSVYIYEYDGAMWVKNQKLFSLDASDNDRFGTSVALYGDTLVIGANGVADNGYYAGAVYVYKFNGDEWVFSQKILADDGTEKDLFGGAVAIDGTTIVIGANGKDDNGDNAGSAYVFTLDGGTWIQQQKLMASDGEKKDVFGHAIAIDNDLLVIGASRDDDNGEDAGAAYVFAFNGFQWIETEKIVPTDGYSYDHFGVALALDGSTLLIGSEGDDDKGDNSGSAYIFRFINDTWVQDAKILTIDGEKNDEVASSVALYKNTVLVSAYRDDDLGEDAGAVYWFGITHSACCPGDVNDDGIVDTDDLFIVLGEWGNDGSSPGDINDDDIVNTDDLFIILNNWGMSC